MSRDPVRDPARKTSTLKLTPEEQQERMSYSSSPNIKGLGEAAKRIQEMFGVEVTEYYLRCAITKRRLNRHYIAHHIYFSDRDLYDFIVLGTKRASA